MMEDEEANGDDIDEEAFNQRRSYDEEAASQLKDEDFQMNLDDMN